MVTQAFIMAAGRGERMRPYSDTCPKPLLSVHGKPLLDHILTAFEALPYLKRVVINKSYLAEQIEAFAHQQKRPFEIVLSHEDEPLETGGGLVQAKPFFNVNEALLCVAGDAYFGPNAAHILQQFCTGFNSKAHDFYISLQKTNTIVDGSGDYFFEHNTPKRALAKNGTHMFTSLRILKPQLFWNKPATKWSQLELMDQAERNGTLGGFEHTGFEHVSTPADLVRLNAP